MGIDIQAKKIKKELMSIITERVNNLGMNPDFDGVFSLLMEHNYISENNYNWPPAMKRKQTEEEKRKNAIGKFTNYTFYNLMMDKSNGIIERINPNNFDDVLKGKINEEAFFIREDLKNNLKRIRREYGYAVSIGELGDTSEKDWYVAQRKITNSILGHYGIVSTNL